MARRRKHVKPGDRWRMDQKLEACRMWYATRSPVSVCTAFNIPLVTFKSWKKQAWWADAIAEFSSDTEEVLDARMTNIVSKTMGVLEDRVENGNFVFNQKTGEITRIPISAREASKVATDMLDQRQVIRERNKAKIDQSTTSATLLKLAEEFGKFASAKTIEGTVERIKDAS